MISSTNSRKEKEIKAKMGKQNNFLQLLHTTWFVKLQTDLLIVGLKVKWFFFWPIVL